MTSKTMNYIRESFFKMASENHWSSTIDHSVFLLLLHKDVKLTCSISLYCLTEQYLSVTLLFIRLFTSQHKNQQYIYPYPSIRFYNLKTDLTLFNKFLGVDNCFVFSWPRQQDWCSKVERVWPSLKTQNSISDYQPKWTGTLAWKSISLFLTIVRRPLPTDYVINKWTNIKWSQTNL